MTFKKPARKPIRLIHTSDTHLGDDPGHPRAAHGLTAVIDAVPQLGGEALLLAGDVFDNARVPDSVLDFFLEQIGRLNVPVVVLPGNHDLFDEKSLYHRAPFQNSPTNLHILSSNDGQSVSFPELTLDVWGRAMPMHTPEFKPLAGMPEATDGRWLVALAHGHFHFDDDKDLRSSPIYPDEIAQATCHYLALGHWDRHVDVSQRNVVAAYSGAPLGVEHSTDRISVNVVDLNPELGVSFQQTFLNGTRA